MTVNGITVEAATALAKPPMHKDWPALTFPSVLQNSNVVLP